MADERSRRSEVWKFFKIVENQGKNKVSCSLCSSQLAYVGGSTGSMYNHLRFKHSEIFISNTRRCRIVRACRLAYQKNNQDSTDPAEKNDREKRMEKLVAMCAMDLHPPSIVEGMGFKAFIQEINPIYEIPGKKELQRCLNLHYEAEKHALKEKLANEVGMGVTVDLWSTLSAEEYFTLTVHFLDKKWQLNHFVLGTRKVQGHLPSHSITVEINRLFTEFEVMKNKVYGFVTENEANMANCANTFGWRHFKCFGQTLQLAIRCAFDEVGVLSDTISAAKALVGHFNQSVLASLELQPQLKADLPQTELVSDCASHWYTTFDMFECLLQHRLSIYEALHHAEVVSPSETTMYELSDSQWSVMQAMVPVLRPLYVATRIMCSEEYPGLSGVYPILCSLRSQHLRVYKADIEAVAEFKRIVTSILDRCYSMDNWCKDPALICSFLDPRYKSLLFLKPTQRSAVQAEVISLIQAERHSGTQKSVQPSAKRSRSENMESDMAFLLGKYYQEGSATNSSCTPADEVQQYVTGKAVPTAVNPISWWAENASSFPTLAKVARKFLCIPATCVPSGRVFSTADRALLDQRASLDADALDALLFVRSAMKELTLPADGSETPVTDLAEEAGAAELGLQIKQECSNS
ncbi:E3 SUMO-protein ligase ZBED1-like [Amia ocellicauda]|uniref:E3 SUMO-protein ligase ZBED1-like n=1 Tax=Amia ocellicauda TaxID=2972642 RepID=UPI003463DEDC